MLGLAKGRPELLDSIGPVGDIAAGIVHAAREEMALTLEDALNELSTLCLTDLQIDGKTIMGRIPEPRPMVRKLLNLAKIELPNAVVSRGVTVSTRKKLVSERIMR